jgi:hypothetical protein
MTLDLNAYFVRIGYRGAAGPNLEVLQDRASAHQTEAASSREQLDEQWKRADSIDPRVKGETGGSADDPASGRDAAWSQEQPIPDNSPTEDMSAHHRETGRHNTAST